MQFVKQFDTVIACSKTVSKNILPFGIRSQVITNAFDDSIIPDTVKAKSKGDLRKELNIPKGGKVFITISSNLPGKNIPFIIDAFCDAENLRGDVLLVAGFVRPSILDRYRGVSKIRFLGRVKNIFEYYKASDFFISASLSEGMPNGVLEVMAMGVPVILSDIGAHKEIARSVDYPIGAIFRNHDAGDFTRSITEVKTADWERLSRNCVNCIKTCFDGSRMSKDYQKLYRSLYHSIADNYGTKCV
jgi:glycosyltransferase involved in cell wall biosynthesis